MKLFLRDFETFPAQTCLEAGPGQIQVEYDGVCDVQKATADVGIQQSGDEFFCQAEITALATLECARCLTPFTAQLQSRADFIVCSEATYEARRAEAADDEDYVFYRGESYEADISDIVRQAIILAVPMMPLCKEDCKGLCPICKVNRNEQQCDCKNDDIDERWAALKDLPRE